MLNLLVSAALLVSQTQTGELRREALMEALRGGGYTVILRHARTDRSFNEARDYVPKTRAEQRNLNGDGIRDAALMGVVFRKYDVKFADVISSPMYRCVETAEMAYRKPDMTTLDLRIFPSTPAQAALVATPPKPRSNRLLVTHHFVIETHVPGIKPGEIGESEAAVVQIVDGKVQLVGRITLDDWRALANPSATATAASTETMPGGHPPVSQPPVANGPVAYPDTHAGHMAQLYVQAFNSGDRETMRKFTTSSMLVNPDRPIEQRLDTYVKLFGDFGPLTLTGVEKTESTEVVLGVQSKVGAMRMTLVTLTEEPMRIKSVTFAYNQALGHR